MSCEGLVERALAEQVVKELSGKFDVKKIAKDLAPKIQKEVEKHIIKAFADGDMVSDAVYDADIYGPIAKFVTKTVAAALNKGKK